MDALGNMDALPAMRTAGIRAAGRPSALP